jgi:hypothetical protein
MVWTTGVVDGATPVVVQEVAPYPESGRAETLGVPTMGADER